MTKPDYILPLEECIDIALVGGKAVNLGVLLRAGFPVPGGFAITTAAFAGRALPQDAIFAAIVAAYHVMGGGPVAVRSSATAEDMAGASMAGQYDTFLHVHDDASLLDAVTRCWASVRSDRTRSYLAGHGIDIDSVAMAVVVQRLVRADIAGVLFTANPRTGDRGEMLIEATWGLGESLVSGRIQPDVLRVDRAGGGVIEQRIGDKRLMMPAAGPQGGAAESVSPDGEVETPEHLRRTACLKEADIAGLWRLGRQAAEHFRAEQDIEWAIDGGQLFLLQSRPITTLEESEAYQRILLETRDDIRRDARGDGTPRGPWVRHNLGETLPHPTPLTWSVMQPFMTGAGGFGAMYRLAGFEPSADVCRDGFLKLIAGRIYMDASRAAGIFQEAYPYQYDLDLLRKNPDAAQSPPTIPAGSFIARWKAGRRIGDVQKRLAALAGDLDRELRHEIFPAFGDYCGRERAKDLAAMSADELAECWEQRRAAVLDDFAPMSLLPSLVEGMALGELKQFLAEEVWDEDAGELSAAVSSSPVPNMTLLADAGLYELASGRRTIDDWLKHFGHRAAGEFDLSVPRWRDQPDAVRTMADRLAGGADPMSLHESHASAVRERVAKLRAAMPEAAAKEFDRRLDLVWRYIVFREDGKYFLMLGYALLRDVAIEIGRRTGLRDGVFFLTAQEMLAALVERGPSASELAASIAARRIQHRAEVRISLPHVIVVEEIEALGTPPKIVADGVHEAFAVSTGVAAGPAKIVRSPAEAGDLGKGYVLVCPSTDPNWTPLFVNASALVLECGGTLSHGAVVAREMGLPAVVLPDATRLFTDGQLLRVDGHHGAVGPADAGEPGGLSAAKTVLSYNGGAVDPNDTFIEARLLPPPPGGRDRRAGRWACAGLLVWGIFLVLAFLLPEHWLYQPSLRVLDAIFWPLVPMVGKPLTVAIIAALVAFTTMVMQRVLTDNRRLGEAKRRSDALSKQAALLPAGSPRLVSIRRATAAVQGRLFVSAMVPMAVFLGPMVMTFFWFPARMDPASWNAAPGTVVQVEAELSSAARGTASVAMVAPLRLDSATPPEQAVEDVSTADKALGQLLVAWEGQSGSGATRPADEAIADQIDAAKTRGDSPAALRQFLGSGPLAPRPLRWTVHTPTEPGRWPIAVQGPDGAVVTLKAVVGDTRPPEPSEVQGDAGTSLTHVRLIYESRPPGKFWRPLSGVIWQPLVQRGWNQWDAGWLWTYLLAYLPAMFISRRALGIA
ncbi:PEP/pyruvate-binding domain-containing protein [Humisphaera borealis]|uniref:Phosphoenolpyruvate synthase n=1 Tax=Humisphaera borealis TaxID=2807512 RepID=A0A7M2X1V9_9BACT|nr:PEP/pyruvate-binding domain-containing protein [Humisphaera borealis]QOV91654.1 hypothetical protein IPV69_09935 [Humisphaera borealis]